MSVIKKITLQYAFKNELFLNYCITVHLQIPYFYFFCKWAKNAVNINFFFNKGHIWRQHYQISFKKLSNLCKKLLHELNFSQRPKVKLFYVSAEFSHYFTVALTMKNWSSRPSSAQSHWSEWELMECRYQNKFLLVRFINHGQNCK